jgi:exopolysaccharide biosynthesis predicted pyruvyltransferase EpsI
MSGRLDWSVDNGPLAEWFRWARNRSVLYFPNPGNAGDSLIALSAYQMFARHSIAWQPMRKQNLSGEIVVIGGGGNMIPLYGGTANMAKLAMDHARMVVVLPHTVKGQEDVFRDAGPQVRVFCRDVPSYAECLGYDSRARFEIGHDMAFFLDWEAVLADPETVARAQPRMTEILEARRMTLARSVAGRDVNCLRGDKERTEVLRPKGNTDVSAVFTSGVRPEEAKLGSWMLLEFLRLARSVTTNRLHAAIGSCLVGTPVRIGDNSYGKVSSIWRHSIRGRYAGAEFLPAEPAAANAA